MSAFYCPRCKRKFEDKTQVGLMCPTCGFQLSTYRIEKSVRRRKIFKRVKPFAIIALIIAIIGIGTKVLWNNSKLGTVCEDGGIIFFDKHFYSNGWRYLAMAPKDIPATSWSETVNNNVTEVFNKKLGWGAWNSYVIINRYGAKSAAYKATDFGKTEDWYLGNRKELSILHFVYKRKLFQKRISNIEDFESIKIQNNEEQKSIYWTSERIDTEHSYCFNFEDGKSSELSNSEKCYVRPIRKF